MRIKSLSKQDAILVLEVIHESVFSRSEEQLIKTMARLRELVPYQAGLSSITRTKDGLPDSLKVVNIDYPDDYLTELHSRDLIMKDPIVTENFKTFQLQYWADTFERTKFTSYTHEIISLAEDYGFGGTSKGHGYGHGIKARNGSVASFFCYHGLERSTRTEEILTLLIPHFHEALSRISSPDHATISGITPREREILEWLVQGKSNWDISVILRISERTVKFHVGNILRKLNASTRSHAVAIVLEHGIVSMD